MQHEHNEEEHWPLLPGYRPISREFHSLELDGPFQHCMICNAVLADDEVEYLVERIFRGTEPIVEYAMCTVCQQEMCSELSEESQEQIRQVFERVDYEARIDRLRESLGEDSVAPWLDRCILTGKRREECRGYQIIGQFRGAQMCLSITPFMLSDQAVEEIMKVISKKTRDRLEGFMGDHFGMPPEFCEHPDFFPVLI